MKLVKTLLIASSLLVGTGLYQFVNKPDANAAVSTCPALLQHQVKDIHGKVQNLCQYQGKVVLVVNTASFCGYTPQYKDLQTLYDRYQKKGLVILGFPANNFGKQEPGSNQEIAKFCKENYKVSFPMFGKTQVTGTQASSLFKQLTQKTGQAPLWNFHKYLVDRQGKQVASFDSGTTPLNGKLTKQLEQMLAAK